MPNLVKTNGRPTMADVARLAGVSKMAVSAVMHKGQGKTTRVSEETASLIHAAAEKLGYRTNFAAQSLATGRTGFIGFMLSSVVSQGFLNPYFAGYLQGVEAECRKRNYGLAISCAPFSEAGKFIRSDILSQRKIDALIVAGELDTAVYLELKSAKIPFIVLNAMRQETLPVVDTMAIQQIIVYAVEEKYRNIWITRDRHAKELEAPEFEKPFAKAMKSGTKAKFIVPSEGQHPNWEPGFGLGRHLLELWRNAAPAERPDLIVSNGALVEFYAEFVKAGFKCPEDVSLLGDNYYNFINTYPEFSRLKIDHAKVGAKTVEMLIAAIAAGQQISQEQCANLKFEVTFIKGETSR